MKKQYKFDPRPWETFKFICTRCKRLSNRFHRVDEGGCEACGSGMRDNT